MRCEHPDCTGNHDDRKYDTLCPRTRDNKRRQGREEWFRNHERNLEYSARYRTTAAYMLSQVRHDASRRGGRKRETA